MYGRGGCSNSSSSPTVLTPVVAPTGGNPSGGSGSDGTTYKREYAGISEIFITSKSGGNYLILTSVVSSQGNPKTWEWGTFTSFAEGQNEEATLVGRLPKLKGTCTADGWTSADGTCVLSKTHLHNGSEWVDDAVSNWKTVTNSFGRIVLNVD